MRTIITLIKIFAVTSFAVYILHGETLLSVGNLVHEIKNTEIEGHTFFMDYDIQSICNYYKNKINTNVTTERVPLLIIVHFPAPSSLKFLCVRSMMGEVIWKTESSTVFCNHAYDSDRYIFLTHMNVSLLSAPLVITNSDEWNKREWYPQKPLQWCTLKGDNNVLEMNLLKNGLYYTNIRKMSSTENTMMALFQIGNTVKVK